MNYLLIFFQSNLLEMPLYLPFLKYLRKDSTWGSHFIFVTGINSLTHPIVFFFIMNLKNTYLQNILLAESFAILAEALILWWVLSEKFWKCITISAFANFSSWQLSPMVTYTYH